MTDQGDASKRLAFVIIPFGGWFETYYKTIYQDVVEGANLQCVRGDSIFASNHVMGQIVQMIKRSEFVIADLTGANPNVYYELGLAHSFRKPSILAADRVTALPFDIRHKRVHFYDKNSPDWGQELRANLKRSIAETLDDPSAGIPPEFFDGEGIREGRGQIDSVATEQIAEQVRTVLGEYFPAGRPGFAGLPNTWQPPSEISPLITQAATTGVFPTELFPTALFPGSLFPKGQSGDSTT